jgi:hypothetical protein
MASLIDSFLGQQDVPDLKTLSTQDILGSIYQSLPQLQKINDTFNMNNAVGGTQAQLAGEKLYDPNRAEIRGKAGSLLSGQLDNPYALPPQIAALLRQQGFEGAAGSGLNTSDAGRAGVASLLGRNALEYGESIINKGLGYGSNTANLFNPSAAVTPGDVGSMTTSANAQNNAISQYKSDLDFQNSMNLINRPLEIGGKVGNIAGQIVGGIFGTNTGGGMSGMFGGGGGASSSTTPLSLPASTGWGVGGNPYRF